MTYAALSEIDPVHFREGKWFRDDDGQGLGIDFSNIRKGEIEWWMLRQMQNRWWRLTAYDKDFPVLRHFIYYSWLKLTNDNLIKAYKNWKGKENNWNN